MWRPSGRWRPSAAPILAVVACDVLACTSGAAPDPHPPASATPAPATPSTAETWDQVRLEDETPVCVFASHDERNEAPFIRDVHAQTLRANSTVVFGTFPLGCHNEACDAVPTHQCWVDSEEERTMVLHSRLSYQHKRGSACTEDCRPVVAGCETGKLRAGNYTVKYGRRTLRLQVPSVLPDPCFELK